jgi:hypothetical protein
MTAIFISARCVPYVSAYICAKERSVKHQFMSVLAKATFPRSGLSRSSGSGSIALCVGKALRI